MAFSFRDLRRGIASPNRRRTARTYRRQPWSTWAFTGLLLVMVASAAPEMTRIDPVHIPHWRIPFLFLAAGFAAGHLGAIRFEFSGELQDLTLTEVPLLIGLVFAGPDRLLLAAALGGAATVLRTHDQPIKALFNVAVLSLETVVATFCFRVVLHHSAANSVKGAMAALAAVVAANLVTSLCVQVVIALSIGRFDRSQLETLVAVGCGMGVLNASVGIVAVDLLWDSSPGAVAFSGIAVALSFGYRSVTRLRQRHEDLEAMYRFSQRLAGLTEADDVIRAVLSEARSRLRGGLAELAVNGADGLVRYSLRGDGPMQHFVDAAPHPLRSAVETAGQGVLAPRATSSEALTGALAAAGFRDAVAVAVPVVDGPDGTLIVADRQSDLVSFDRANLRLLEVLAGQAATALNAARLLDLLRAEVAAKNHLALHDPLTDLANRDLFNEQVEASLAERSETAVVAVMLMDLDRFKNVNDTLGHESGDVVLQQIAAQLTRAVADRGSVGRLGGDEFAVVAVVEDRAELATVIHDVVVAGHAAISVDGRRLDVGASLGVAIAPEHGEDRSTLLRAADVAMYHAKANEGGAAFYEPQRDYRRDRPIESAGELSSALDRPS